MEPVDEPIPYDLNWAVSDPNGGDCLLLLKDKFADHPCSGSGIYGYVCESKTVP